MLANFATNYTMTAEVVVHYSHKGQNVLQIKLPHQPSAGFYQPEIKRAPLLIMTPFPPRVLEQTRDRFDPLG